MTNPAKQDGRQASLQTQYDFIVVGAGAAGSVLAAELSASGAHVLVVESGGLDDAPTIEIGLRLLHADEHYMRLISELAKRHSSTP